MRRLPSRWRRFAHLAPYAFNNSLRGIRHAAKRYNAIDLDFQVTKDRVVVNTHWGQPLKHGFYDPLGKIHRNAKIEDLTWAEVRRLRTRRGHYRINTANRMFQEAARLGMRVEFEAKGSKGFHDPAIWRRLKRHADRHGIEIQVKTLTSIPGAYKRLAAAHAAGFTTIVLPRGSRRLRKDLYGPVTDYVRGRVRWV